MSKHGSVSVKCALICPGIRIHAFMLCLSREAIGNFFSLPVPNIHSPFYLPHNVEMEEVKRVCPLESIVTAAITQVI